MFRLGQWEYDYIYRSVGQESLEYSRNKFGLWVYEVAERIGAIVRGDTGAVGVKYIHNIAHDGSMSYLLSALQVRQMVWPGLGAEVVFEVWSASSGRRMHGGGDDNDGDDDDDDASVVDTGIGVGEEQEQESSESPETLQESRKKDYYIRILWNGQPLHSNAAELGKVDMLPAEQVLGYLRSLVGTERESGGDVVERCKL